MKAIIFLKGGIGNQLFQIAFAKQNIIHNHFFEESLFNIDYFKFDTYSRSSILQRLFPEFLIISKETVVDYSSQLLVSEDQFSAYIAQPKNFCSYKWIIFDGYWQDLSYLNQDAFNFINKRLNDYAVVRVKDYHEWKKIFSGSIALHIRRHDYKHHGVCHENYYVNSINWLQQKYSFSKIYLFTDEPNYSLHFLRSHNIQPGLISTKDDILDLWIMSLCDAHVISNSTFSWWGAVLAESKFVIYPDPWSLIHKPSSNLCPVSWIKVKNAISQPALETTFFDALNQGKLQRDLQILLNHK